MSVCVCVYVLYINKFTTVYRTHCIYKTEKNNYFPPLSKSSSAVIIFQGNHHAIYKPPKHILGSYSRCSTYSPHLTTSHLTTVQN